MRVPTRLQNARYDFIRSAEGNGNHRSYLRSMFERFGWRRLGGTVLRYQGRALADGTLEEDWLHDVIPSLIFFRSYVLNHQIEVRFFTLDSMSVAHLDFSDPGRTFGILPQRGAGLDLRQPTNTQSSERRIRDFVDAAVSAAA
jgi:hypothetical protein